MDYQEAINQTYRLSNKLTDKSSVRKIKSITNTGKRIQMCVSTTLILDTLDAFGEYYKLLSKPDGFQESKVSLALLTRYIFESYVNFLYIFKSKKGHMQVRAKAFYHYGSFKKGKMQGRDDLTNKEKEWNKYIPRKGRKTQWHGKTFQELCKETNYSPVVYQVLSQFTHPGIFTMERVLNTEMFEGILGDSVLFTSAAVCDMMAHANNLKLYGIKTGKSSEKDINALVSLHETLLADMKKSADPTA